MRTLLFLLLITFIAQARCLKSHVVDYKNGDFARENNCVPYPAGDSYCFKNYGKGYKATLSKGCNLKTSFDLPRDVLIELGLIKPEEPPKPELEITTRDLFLHECEKNLEDCDCPVGAKVEENIYIQSPTGKARPMISCQPMEQVASDLFSSCLNQINSISENMTINEICQDQSKKSKVAQDCFEFILPGTLKYIKDFPIRCWYSISKFSSNYGQFKRQMKSLMNEREDINCNYSICTSATALAITNYYRDIALKDKVLSEDEKDKLQKKIWKYINISATPNELVENLKIGTGHIQHASLGQIGTNHLPQPGDLVQMWRNFKPYSGHSVVFKGFTYDEDKNIKDICYWSSQPGTRGYGVACEAITRVDKFLIGHLNGGQNE